MSLSNDTITVRLNGSARKPAFETPAPEVSPKKTRRSFTAAQKLKILADTDGLETGELGTYLRKTGLYHSHLHSWRQHREDGLLVALSPKKRGRQVDPEAKRVAELEKERDKLLRDLEKAKLIIDVQKKLCRVLGLEEA